MPVLAALQLSRGAFITRIDVDDVASSKWKLGATPKLFVLFDGIGVVVEHPEVVRADFSTDKDPHPLDRYGLFVIVYRDAKNQLRKIARSERLPPLGIGNVKVPRRFTA